MIPNNPKSKPSLSTPQASKKLTKLSVQNTSSVESLPPINNGDPGRSSSQTKQTGFAQFMQNSGGGDSKLKKPTVKQNNKNTTAEVQNPQLETDRAEQKLGSGSFQGKNVSFKEELVVSANAQVQQKKGQAQFSTPTNAGLQSSGLTGLKKEPGTQVQPPDPVSLKSQSVDRPSSQTPDKFGKLGGLRSSSALGKPATKKGAPAPGDQSVKASNIGKPVFQAKPAEVQMILGNCPYCLDKDVNVVNVGCGHEFCSKCCMNLIKITKIKKGLNFAKLEGIIEQQLISGATAQQATQGMQVIKCPKCAQIVMLSNEKMEEIHTVLDYDTQLKAKRQDRNNGQPKNCMVCSTKANGQRALYECLNCESTYLCEQCKTKHLKTARNKGHKVVSIIGPDDGAGGILVKVDDQQCPDHMQKFRLYCYTDDKPLCLKCTETQSTNPDDGTLQQQTTMPNQESNHASHFVKSITTVLEQSEKEKDQLKQEIQNEVDKIASATEYFTGVEDILMNQKNLQLRKLAADFEVINKLVERKHAELRDKISSAYDKHLREAFQYVEGLNSIKETITGLQDRKIKVDIDQVILNKAISGRLKELQTELDFELKDADMDIIESRFLFEPFQRIEKALMDYNFFPIQRSQLQHLEVMFQISQKSKILTRDILTPEFLLLILPPKVVSASLLYCYSKELKRKGIIAGAGGAQRFHAKCDNMGPTLTFVKANDGHIFGGFNPASWVSEFMYCESDEAYLFSVADGKGRKPVKCPIKPHKKDKAIKQNEKEYSPAFGEANVSDLFIAYKNPANSYSMLGNVYKLPKGYESETFLAGKHSDWVIEDIEVWAIKF